MRRTGPRRAGPKRAAAGAAASRSSRRRPARACCATTIAAASRRSVSADSYLWTGARRTRAFREFRLLDHLARVGPAGAGAGRGALRARRACIIAPTSSCGAIPSVETLAERLARGALDASLGERVGATIARFHAAGACHADLNAHNILLDARDNVALIDFDRGDAAQARAGRGSRRISRACGARWSSSARRKRFDDFERDVLAPAARRVSRDAREIAGRRAAARGGGR